MPTLITFIDKHYTEEINGDYIYARQNSSRNIYNGIALPSLNHAKIFDSIPDEHSHKVVHQLTKSHAQWFTSNKLRVSCPKGTKVQDVSRVSCHGTCTMKAKFTPAFITLQYFLHFDSGNDWILCPHTVIPQSHIAGVKNRVEYCGWFYFRGYQFSWIGQKLYIRGVQNSWP